MDIYIYGDIGYEVNAQDIISQIDAAGSGEITLHISSNGGDVFDGFAIANRIREHKGASIARVEGIAASMASIIAVAADRVLIAEDAFFMVHNPQSTLAGEASQLRDRADALDRTAAQMLAAYRRKTGASKATIREWMKGETWFNAEESIRVGLADEMISEQFQAAACLERTHIPYHNPPKELTMSGKRKQEPANQASEFTARMEEIDSLIGSCESLDGRSRDAIRAQAIAQNLTPEQVGERLLDMLGCDTVPLSGSGVLTDVRSNTPAPEAVSDYLAFKFFGKHVPDAAKETLDLERKRTSILDVAKMVCSAKGVRTERLDDEGIWGAAWTGSPASDFPYALGDSIEKALIGAMNEVQDTAESWTSVYNATSLRTVNRAIPSETPNLIPNGEGEDVRTRQLQETGGQYEITTYAEDIALTRRAIINDDLGMFQDQIRGFGMAARRTMLNRVWSALEANQLWDGTSPIFHADNNNLIDPGTAPDTAALSAMMTLLARQTGVHDEDKNPLGLVGQFVLCPTELAIELQTLIASSTRPSTDGQGAAVDTTSAVQNLVVVSDPRLTDPKAFYMVANPMVSPVIDRAFLDGSQVPTVRELPESKQLGMAWRAVFDFGTAAIDYRGAVKNLGGS